MTQKKDSVGANSPLSYHPDIISPGMEAIHHEDHGKEVVEFKPQEQHAHYEDEEKFAVSPQNEKKKRRRICGVGLPLCFVLCALALVALAIGLGVGLGVGLNKKFAPLVNLQNMH